MATLIFHIYVHNNLIIKTLYHAINIISTKVKFFAIRCDINQATQMTNINHIIVIIDSIDATKRIFDSLVYLYQIQLFTISRELGNFLVKIYLIPLNFGTVQAMTSEISTI